MSTVIIKKAKKNTDKENEKTFGVYYKSLLERKVCLNITEIGKNVKNNIEKKLEFMLSGKYQRCEGTVSFLIYVAFRYCVYLA